MRLGRKEQSWLIGWRCVTGISFDGVWVSREMHCVRSHSFTPRSQACSRG